MNTNHRDPSQAESKEACLTAYALGELAPEMRSQVEAGAAKSVDAQRLIERTRAMAEQVREAARRDRQPEPSPGLRAAVEGRLQELAARPAPGDPKARRGRRLAWRLAALAVCLLALAAGLVPVVQPAREAARNGLAGLAGGVSASGPAESPSKESLFSMAPKRIDDGVSEEKKASGPADRSRGGVERPADIPHKTALSYIKTDPAMSLPAMPADPAMMAPGMAPGMGMPAMPGGTAPRDADAVMPPGYGDRAPSAQPMPGDPAAHAPPNDATALDTETLRTYSDGVPAVGPSTPSAEQYDRIEENGFRAVGDQPLSTFSIDVDTASYANVRRFLRERRLPPPEAVRIEEMINYFTYHYPQPEAGQPFSVNAEVAECPWNPQHRLLRIGLRGRDVERDRRGPCNLVFLLDVSGSMAEENKLPLVKQAMKMLVERLGENDRVAIVVYADDARVHLASANGTQKANILQAIDVLRASGCTNGGAGIQMAYAEAARHFVAEGSNRVILATDGDLNVGITDDQQLVALIRDKARTGVFLTVLGVGTGNLKDSKLQKLADRGNGIYAYLDTLREARRVLIEQMSGSLVTIAKDVKVQIEFNPAEVLAYRQVGYEKRRLAAQDFHNDRKDAGEIGAGHTVTALYELVPARGPRPAGAGEPLRYQRVPDKNLTDKAQSGEMLLVKLRYKQPDGQESKLLQHPVKESGKRFGQASADFRFAAAVASFGMLLRHSPYAGNSTPAGVEEIAAAALDDDPGGYRAEFVDLVRGAEGLGLVRGTR